MGTDIHGKLRIKDWDDNYEYIDLPPYFAARDYDFFAILGGVRNGTGFAGSKRYNNSITPIAPNRGYPEGTTSIYGEENGFDEDLHSISYITLADLQNTDLHKQSVIKHGIFSEDDYLKKLKGEEHSWCSFVSGLNVEVISEKKYKKGDYDSSKDIYIKCKWKDKPFKRKINKLRKWMELYHDYGHKPEDIILIFGFDN